MLKQLSERVYVMPFDAERDRPHIGYIHGEKFSVLVDAGNSPDHLRTVLKEIKAHGLPEPTMAIITHWHWDHTFSMHAFKGTTIAHKKTNDILKILTSWEWTEDAMNERLRSGEECQFCHDHILIEYDDFSKIKVVTADIVYDNTLSLDLGNLNIQVIPIDNPHSDDGVVVFVEEEKVLFAGDADSGEYYKLDGGYDKDRFYHYVKTVDQLPYDTYVHGHVGPYNREETKAFRQAIIDEEL